MPWRAWALGGVASFALFALGCSNGNPAKTGKGDKLIVDVDATITPPQATADAGADSPYGVTEDGYGAYSYSPVAVCAKCACGSGTYCFGGGTGHTTFSGNCSGGSGLSVGCQPLPAACAGAATCECIFQALKSQISCYAVCEPNSGPAVYCPEP